MANVLQDYFDRMTALNRQRGMTGNMQYGKAIDSSLAEGYFDSYEKNKGDSENRANQKAQLAIMQQNADTSRMGLDVQRYQVDAYKDAQKNSNMWQGLGMGLNAVAVAGKAYGDYKSYNKALPMPNTPISADPMANALYTSATAGGQEQPYGSTQYTQYVPDYSFKAPEVGNIDGQYFQPTEFSAPTYDNVAVFGDDMDWTGFFS